MKEPKIKALVLVICIFWVGSLVGQSFGTNRSSIYKTICLNISDTIDLDSVHIIKGRKLWKYQFSYSDYDQTKGSTAIIITSPALVTSDLAALALGLGTHFFLESNISPDSIFLPSQLPYLNGDLVQVVVRSEDSYTGFLEELINVPFVLPPMRQDCYGHQTDNRMAVDCAELAIYGIRRMGYNLGYIGPKGVLKYLIESDTLKRGSVIHFGHQVSVLYQDKGVIGALDAEDVLIHAYKKHVELVSLKNTDLDLNNCKTFDWNWELLDSLSDFKE